jgi:hypothetical protein
MLLVMTFNVFLCLAIVIGRAVGMVLSGMISDVDLGSKDKEEADCH